MEQQPLRQALTGQFPQGLRQRVLPVQFQGSKSTNNQQAVAG
jgi:hypothetical protein